MKFLAALGGEKTKPNKANFGAGRLEKAGKDWLILMDYGSGGELWENGLGAIIP
jgi:hypothetical protein